MSKPIIEVKNLSKKYRIMHQESYLALRDVIASCLRNPLDVFKKRFAKSNEDFWALKDVSFDVKEGEVVGVIGRNGAGKTTLLKILSRITYPIKGEACLRGRVGSLLEVGTGFHPELTGRENIFFNGAVLGMKKKEIERKYDEIVEFSGVERFLDTPVKRYSSGMRVRLAFSVAAHLDPEILLIDEVLAVGDVQFQNKCLGKMKNVSESGRTILFVSHDMSAISKLCSRVLMFESGRLIMQGDPNNVVAKYLDQNMVINATIKEKDLEARKEGRFNRANPMMRVKEINLLNHDNSLCTAFKSNEPIKIEITYECLNIVNNLRINVYIVDEENKAILISQNLDHASEHKLYQRKTGLYKSTCVIPADMFGEKRFYLTVHLQYPKVEHLIYERVLGFNVAFEGYSGMLQGLKDSFLRPRLNWSTEKIGEIYEQ